MGTELIFFREPEIWKQFPGAMESLNSLKRFFKKQ